MKWLILWFNWFALSWRCCE